MEGKMKVAVMTGIGRMGFETRDIPQAGPGEVLIKLEYVGICGSDLHYYQTGEIAGKKVETPFVLGHEPGGVVVELGEGVTHLKVGDRAAGATTCALTLFSSPHHRFKAYSKSMSPMKPNCASNCRTM